MTERRKIRWLIAHFPQQLFIRTAKAFAYELEKICPNQFEIEILTMGQYVDKYDKLHEFKLVPPAIAGLDGKKETRDDYTETDTWKDATVKWKTLFEALGNGDFELSQTQINQIGFHLDKNYHAIDLPFLFNDHDHVTRVLDGAIGDNLSAQLAEKTNIRGLAFTYSGGYRVIGSNQKITNLTELAKTKLLTHTAHSNRLFEGVGADSVRKFNLNTAQLADMATNENTSIETTYLRFSGRHVYKTEHSMFTTSILTGNKFWASLTEQQQQAFVLVAKKVAKIERHWSLQDAKKYEDQALANGVEIVAITDQDRVELQQAAAKVYKQLESLDIDPVLVQAIIAQGHNQVH
jgi:TRAP-type C4-dicarboxylate transport system substrate-binding protein